MAYVSKLHVQDKNCHNHVTIWQAVPLGIASLDKFRLSCTLLHSRPPCGTASLRLASPRLCVNAHKELMLLQVILLVNRVRIWHLIANFSLFAVTRCLQLGLPDVPYFKGCPIFGGTCPASRMKARLVPYFGCSIKWAISIQTTG